MSKPIKLKSTVKKFQKNPPSSSLNMTIYEKDMIMSNLLNVLWNCQEMCSRRIPKILDRQESGGVMRDLF